MGMARSVRRAGFSVHWETDPLLSSVFVLWRSLAVRVHEGTSGSYTVVRSGKSARHKKSHGLRNSER